jgi:NAD(P)-dependent dehydrogenase (short-subunit alcohol dehydrogenase family)
MNYGLNGRIALVTGGDSGMGFQTATLLLQEGAKVFLTDRVPDRLEQAARQLSAHGTVEFAVAELTDLSQVEALMAKVTAAFGAPDILVNCAGITGKQGDFLDASDDDWMEALNTNLMSAVRMARAVIPGMKDKGWGRIVLVASEDAVQPYADELPYCASKAGILNLAKGLSKTYAKQGVLVNTVAPAFIATPMTDAMMQKRAEENGTSVEEAIESFLDEERPDLVLHRRGEAEEVAAAILFLCSAQASFINGANIRVDGGSVATMST